MRIGVVGGGVVGSATAKAFATHAEVRVFDVLPERRTHTLAEALFTDIVFLCLPTPQKADSLECDLSAVEKSLQAIREIDDGRNNFVLRSTVPIGTTKRLAKEYGLPNLVHNPEFLSARTAEHDAANPVRNIIGTPRDAHGVESMMLVDLYDRRFPGVPLYRMTSDESETVKLMQNAHSAVKLSFFNECNTLAAKLGLDWERIMRALLAGGWVNEAHTSVPGPDGSFGWGGNCLPKDTANLANCILREGLTAEMCMASITRNKEDRKR